MELSDLPAPTLLALLHKLRVTFMVHVVEEEFDTVIPQWLTIIYRCVVCAKETRLKIQTMSIRQANRTMICPFCRKTSRMFTIRVDNKDNISIL